MGFSGDLKDIDLTNIFQTLGMNQHEGILKVSDAERLAKIYFSKEGIRLLVDGSKPYSLLGELLLRKKLVTESDLRKALKLQKETGKRMGELLVEHGMLSREDLAKVLRDQMEEKIYEVFSWQEARFEFLAEAPAPEDPFFSQGGTPTDFLTFNINAIMMEAARRIDEWGLINEKIPRRSEILQLTCPLEEIEKYEYAMSSDDVALVAGLVNGHRSVEKIINESGMGNFQTCKILKAIVDAGHAELIPTEDVLRLASSFMSAGRVEMGIETFRTAIARTPEDLDLRLRLAEAALDQGEAEVAAEEYRTVGEICEKEGEKRKALESYTTAVELNRGDLRTHERLFSLYQDLQEKHLALEEGRLLARLYADKKDYHAAEEILEDLKSNYALNLGVMKLLVQIHLDRKDKTKAIAELESLAQSCEVKRRFAEAEEAYETILRLDRNRRDVEQKLTRLAGRVKRPKKDRKIFRKVLILAVIALAAYGGWQGFTIVREAQAARQGLAEMGKGIRGLAPISGIEDTEGAYRGALQATEEWLTKLGGMLERFGAKNEELQIYKSTLEDRLKRLEQKIEGRRDKIRARSLGRLQEAVRLKDGGDLGAALAAAEEVIQSEYNYPSTLDDAKALKREIEGRQEGAKGLLLLASEADDAGGYTEAYGYLTELLRRYPHSDAAKGITLPLQVDTLPSGSTVTQDGNNLGLTPLVIRYDPDPADDWSLSLTMAGFEKMEVSRQWTSPEHLERAMVRWNLKKVMAWEMEIGAKVKVRADLTSREGRVHASTTDGRVLTIDPERRELHREVNLGSLSAIVASGVLRDGILCVGTKMSSVAAIHATTGEKIWEKKLGEKFERRVMTSPAFSDDGKMLLVAAGDRLFALEVENGGGVRWSYPLKKEISIPPVVLGATVLVYQPATRSIHRLNVADGEELMPPLALSAPPGTPLYRLGKNLVYCDTSGSLKLVDPLSGKVLWKTPSLGRVLSIRPLGDAVWVSLEEGQVFVARPGAEDWEAWEGRMKLEGRAHSAMRRGDLIYFGTDAGFGYAVMAATGELRWKLALPSGVEAAPCVEGGYVFFAGLEGKIYATLQ